MRSIRLQILVRSISNSFARRSSFATLDNMYEESLVDVNHWADQDAHELFNYLMSILEAKLAPVRQVYEKASQKFDLASILAAQSPQALRYHRVITVLYCCIHSSHIRSICRVIRSLV